LRVNQTGHRTGDADGLVPDDAGFFVGVWEHVALGVQVHVFCSGRGRFFPVVDEMSFPGSVAKKQEPASAKISGLRMDNGKREASSDRSIDGVASRAQY